MSDDRVLRILGLATAEQPTVFDGQYVVDYDPSRPDTTGHGLVCHLITTPHLAEATRYPVTDAFELWRSVDQRNPVRDDGRPNRPLTAFSVEFVDPEFEAG